jgi:hypothetical protein
MMSDFSCASDASIGGIFQVGQFKEAEVKNEISAATRELIRAARKRAKNRAAARTRGKVQCVGGKAAARRSLARREKAVGELHKIAYGQVSYTTAVADVQEEAKVSQRTRALLRAARRRALARTVARRAEWQWRKSTGLLRSISQRIRSTPLDPEDVCEEVVEEEEVREEPCEVEEEVWPCEPKPREWVERAPVAPRASGLLPKGSIAKCKQSVSLLPLGSLTALLRGRLHAARGRAQDRQTKRLAKQELAAFTHFDPPQEMVWGGFSAAPGLKAESKAPEEAVAPTAPKAELPVAPVAPKAEIPVSMKMTRKELEKFAAEHAFGLIKGRTKQDFFDNLCALWEQR